MAISKRSGRRPAWASALAGIVALVGAGLVGTPAGAMSQPKPDTKPSASSRPTCPFGQSYSKKKGGCVAIQQCGQSERWSSYYGACVRKRSGAPSDRDLYKEARWLIENDRFAEARDLLLAMRDQSDPKVLNYIGFTTRKLGDVDKGITYYVKALSIDPNLSIAREYLGEGYLEKGDLAAAKAQLVEIASRCGTTCPEYEVLAEAIGAYILGEPLPKTW